MSGARRARALPPVDSMRLVRNFPACEATDTETKLASLRPAGAPMVIHLFTGCAAGLRIEDRLGVALSWPPNDGPRRRLLSWGGGGGF